MPLGDDYDMTDEERAARADDGPPPVISMHVRVKSNGEPSGTTVELVSPDNKPIDLNKYGLTSIEWSIHAYDEPAVVSMLFICPVVDLSEDAVEFYKIECICHPAYWIVYMAGPMCTHTTLVSAIYEIGEHHSIDCPRRKLVGAHLTKIDNAEV